MITKLQTVVLSIPRLNVPQNLNIIESVTQMIFSNLCNLDYFGNYETHPIDYFDIADQLKYDSTTYLSFHFDMDIVDELETTQYNEDRIFNLLLEKVSENTIHNYATDGKDVNVYIH